MQGYSPKLSRVTPPKLYRVTPPKLSRVTPPKLSRVAPPKLYRVTPPKLSRVTPSKLSRVAPPKLYRALPLKNENLDTTNRFFSPFSPGSLVLASSPCFHLWATLWLDYIIPKSSYMPIQQLILKTGLKIPGRY